MPCLDAPAINGVAAANGLNAVALATSGHRVDRRPARHHRRHRPNSLTVGSSSALDNDPAGMKASRNAFGLLADTTPQESAVHIQTSGGAACKALVRPSGSLRVIARVISGSWSSTWGLTLQPHIVTRS